MMSPTRRRLALAAVGCGAAVAFVGCAAPQQQAASTPSSEATASATPIASPESTPGSSGSQGWYWPDGIPMPEGDVVAAAHEGSSSTITVVMPDANGVEDYMAELEVAGFERVDGAAAPNDPATTAYRTNAYTVTIVDVSTSSETRIEVTEALHIP